MKNVGLLSLIIVSSMMFMLLLSSTPNVDGSCLPISTESIEKNGNEYLINETISDQIKDVRETIYEELILPKPITRGPTSINNFLDEHHNIILKNINTVDSLIINKSTN